MSSATGSAKRPKRPLPAAHSNRGVCCHLRSSGRGHEFDDPLIEALAVVREAGRFLNMRHQLIGGTVVHRDKIAGMRTTNIPPSRGR
jgi:hypothetical protein